MDWKPYITTHPTILHGAICFAGTRIPVTVVLDNLAEGATAAEILSRYPGLRTEHVFAALAYAAELARERVVPIPAGTPGEVQARREPSLTRSQIAERNRVQRPYGGSLVPFLGPAVGSPAAVHPASRYRVSAATRPAVLLPALLALVIAAAAPAFAQAWPAKPVRIVCTLAPGSGVDTTARIVGQGLSEAWGPPVIVDNRPGAAGTIATAAVARAPADGYTLLMTSSGHVSAPALYKLDYDTLKDFAPVSLIVSFPSMLVVHPSVPARTVKELVELAWARPGELRFGSPGHGSPGHLTAELFSIMTGARMTHVPYKGTQPVLTDLVGGRISIAASSVASTMPHVTAGRLRVIAVTSGRRTIAQPQLPTVAESGVPGFAVDLWYGLLAPAGVPREIVARLHEGIAAVVARPEVRQKLLAAGLEPIVATPEDFGRYIEAEVGKWRKVVRAAGIRVE